MKIIVPLAEGFEEIEAVTIIDTLRRAGVDTVTASLNKQVVTGAHGIPVTADSVLGSDENFSGIVLPGGMPGSTNLKNDQRIISLIQKIYNKGGVAAALCAAPIVLAEAGILNGKKYTCYPGFEDEIGKNNYLSEPVITDGNIITGKGPACALPFALKITEILKGKEVAEGLKKQMTAFW
ncbi:MAG TPA: DJ-1/PfpI family protein [Spirochaetota bacterium]|nr:DJ-1/PfpI family protein [Spirochaetota bacterium]HPJ33732.1 DJ-1/PfpI family protein [Spirochaetota bacterium]